MCAPPRGCSVWLQTKSSRISFSIVFLRWEIFLHFLHCKRSNKIPLSPSFCHWFCQDYRFSPAVSYILTLCTPTHFVGFICYTACWKIFNAISLERKWQIFQQMLMGFNGVAGGFYHISDKAIQKCCCNFCQHHQELHQGSCVNTVRAEDVHNSSLKYEKHRDFKKLCKTLAEIFLITLTQHMGMVLSFFLVPQASLNLLIKAFSTPFFHP